MLILCIFLSSPFSAAVNPARTHSQFKFILYCTTYDSLVVSVLDLGSEGPRFEPVGRGWSRSKRGPVALCTLGLGLIDPQSLNGR